MDLTFMHINKGNAHGTQGERSNGDNSAEHRLLTKSAKFSSFLIQGALWELISDDSLSNLVQSQWK